MKTTLFLFVTGALAFAAAPKTFTGVITDAMCGKDHSMMGVKPDAKCVTECVKRGYCTHQSDYCEELPVPGELIQGFPWHVLQYKDGWVAALEPQRGRGETVAS